MVDRLEVLNRHVSGNCSALVAEGDPAVVAHLCKEAAKPQVGWVALGCCCAGVGGLAGSQVLMQGN
jgi:hypothetical protein